MRILIPPCSKLTKINYPRQSAMYRFDPRFKVSLMAPTWSLRLRSGTSQSSSSGPFRLFCLFFPIYLYPPIDNGTWNFRIQHRFVIWTYHENQERRSTKINSSRKTEFIARTNTENRSSCFAQYSVFLYETSLSFLSQPNPRLLYDNATNVHLPIYSSHLPLLYDSDPTPSLFLLSLSLSISTSILITIASSVITPPDPPSLLPFARRDLDFSSSWPQSFYSLLNVHSMKCDRKNLII